jgi:hypothetical protein
MAQGILFPFLHIFAINSSKMKITSDFGSFKYNTTISFNWEKNPHFCPSAGLYMSEEDLSFYFLFVTPNHGLLYGRKTTIFSIKQI